MPSVTIPLVGNPNQRQQLILNETTSNKDQRFSNCVFETVNNPVTGSVVSYIQKRPGMKPYLLVSSGQAGAIHLVSETFVIVSSFGSTIYVGQTACGTAPGALYASEAKIGGVHYFLITSAAGTGWFIASDSYSQTSYTGNRTSGSPVISSIASTAGMYIGQLITGTGIPANTRILSVDSSTQITLTANATSGAATSTTLTKEPIAKIIDSDFPSNIVGQFVYLDGYLFIADGTNKRIYQSNLNSVTSWSASDYLTIASPGNDIMGIAKVGNKIIALNSSSIEFYYNAGNATGSVLNNEKELNRKVGCSLPGLSNDRRNYVSVGDSLFFVGNEDGAERGIYKLNGNVPQRISPPQVNSQITSYSTQYHLSAFFYRGKNYVLLSWTTTTSYMNYLGCVENGIWTEIRYSNTLKIYGGLFGNTSSTKDSTGLFVVSGSADGYIHRLANDFYTDIGSSFTLSCQTSKTDFNTDNLKTIKSVALMGTDIQSSIKYLNLDGASGCYASTPDSSSFDFGSGTIELVVKLSMTDYTPSSSQWVIAQDTTGAANSAFRLTVNSSGELVFEVSNGSSYLSLASTVATGLTDGSIAYIKASYQFNDGGGNRVGKFYTSYDGVTYTQLGSTVTTAGTVTKNNSSTSVTIGAHSGGNGNLSGKVYYAEVRNGIDGTVVAKFDPSTSASDGDSSFTASTGEVWTINGTASIVESQYATLEYSDDDYSSWTTAGTFDLTTVNPRIYRCGSYRGGRAWRLTHSADSAFRAQALKFDYEVGRH